MRRGRVVAPPPRDGTSLHALNAANADAQLDDLLHQYFRLATPPSAPARTAAKRRLKRPHPGHRDDPSHEQQPTETPETPESVLKRLKKFLKDSGDDRHIHRVLAALTNQLHRAKRQRALLAFAVRLATELFARSAAFRTLISTQAAAFYTTLLEAAGEQDVVARRRRPRGQTQSDDVRLVLAMIERWTEDFGPRYPTLVAGHAGLVEMGYAFPRVHETREQLAQQAAERLQVQSSVRELQMRKMEREMRASVPEMETTMVEMDNIFEILVPTLEAFEVEEKASAEDAEREQGRLEEEDAEDEGGDDDDAVEWEEVTATSKTTGLHAPHAHEEDDDEEDVEWEDAVATYNDDEEQEEDEDQDHDALATADDMDINDIVQAYGLGSSTYQLTISIPTTLCEQSAENEVLFRSLADGVLQIRKRFLPLVRDWLQIADDDAVATEQPRDAALLRQLHDLRRRLEAVTLKWEDLVKENERKQFASIRPRVVTLPLATFGGKDDVGSSSSSSRPRPRDNTLRRTRLKLR